MSLDTAAGDGQTPPLRLEELLAQLNDRTREALQTQDRLRGLVEANLAIVGDLDLSTVLRRIVEAARDLVGAEYAALGVIGADDTGLEEFITVGMSQADIEAIGRLPQGKGILGALIDDPRPIRLDHLGDDHRSVGFPEGHPPMDSFIGVPIRVRDEVFGNLYLTNARTGRFGDGDEALASSLAATAGVAIANARLFGESRRRQEWLRASADMSRQTLSLPNAEALRGLVERVLMLADADLVTMVVPHAVSGELEVAATVGCAADDMRGSRLPLSGTATEEVILSGAPALVANLAERDVDDPYVPRQLSLGPAMLLPLTVHETVRGVLIAARKLGRQPFDGADLDMAATFATHASLALELAEARVDQQRMALLQDRTRIARDLHDHVIQQLFAAGMLAQGVATELSGDSRGELLEKVVDALDDAVKQIRTSIFQLRPHHYTGTSLRSLVLALVTDVTPALGFEPHVRFEGPVDAVSDDALADDVLAVVREALTNVAKHAEAVNAHVRVEATDSDFRVVVEDDGVGIDSSSRASGLANLRHRAERRGGRLALSSGRHGRGTCLVWSSPLG